MSLKVFEILNKENIISLHNAGYTQSDGYNNIMEIYHENKNIKII